MFVTEEKSVFMGLTTRDNLKVADVALDDALGTVPRARAAPRRPRRAAVGWRAADAQPGPRACAAGPRCCWPTSCRWAWRRWSSRACLQAVRDAADQHGAAVLLVEQHVRQALRYADRAYVMRRGRIDLSGTATELRGRLAEIEDSYLTNSPNGDQPTEEHHRTMALARPDRADHRIGRRDPPRRSRCRTSRRCCRRWPTSPATCRCCAPTCASTRC